MLSFTMRNEDKEAARHLPGEEAVCCKARRRPAVERSMEDPQYSTIYTQNLELVLKLLPVPNGAANGCILTDVSSFMAMQ